MDKRLYRAFHADEEFLKNLTGNDVTVMIIFEFKDSDDVDGVYQASFVAEKGDSDILIAAKLENLAKTIRANTKSDCRGDDHG